MGRSCQPPSRNQVTPGSRLRCIQPWKPCEELCGASLRKGAWEEAAASPWPKPTGATGVATGVEGGAFGGGALQPWVWLHLPHKNPAGVLFSHCCVDAWSLREQAAGEARPAGPAGATPWQVPGNRIVPWQ